MVGDDGWQASAAGHMKHTDAKCWMDKQANLACLPAIEQNEPYSFTVLFINILRMSKMYTLS